MRRLLWVGVGAVATIVVLRKVRGFVDRHTPPGVRTAVGAGTAVVETVREFGTDVRTGMAERERELRETLLAERDARRARPRHSATAVDDEPAYEF